MSRSTSWFLLVFCLAGLLLGRESHQPRGALAGVDRVFFDWLADNAQLGPPGRGEIPVTLVEIDDSVGETPGRIPLTPLEYGSFLRSLSRYDPAVVAIEPVLDFPRVTSGTEEILLGQALGLSKLLLGVQLGDNAEHGRDPSSLPALANPVPGSTQALPQFPEILSAPNARLLAIATASGATNLPNAASGPVRDVPLVFRSRDRVLPAFTLQALTLSLRLASSEVSAAPGGEVRLGDRLRVPVNAAGRALLDARAFERFGRLGLDDLPLIEAGQASPPLLAQAGRLRGGIVVLGRTDRAARTLRLPGGRAVSPAEVFAWAAASLQHAPATRRASTWWDAAIFVLFAVAGWIGWRMRGGTRALLIGVLFVVYLLAALSIFAESRLWLPIALPVGLSLVNALLPWLWPNSAATVRPPP